MRILKNSITTLSLIGSLIISNSNALAIETFSSQNIGEPATGTATYLCSLEQFTMSSSEADITGSHDAFQFVHKELTGNIDLIANIDSNTAIRSGLMIRNDKSDNAKFAAITHASSQSSASFRVFKGEPVIPGNNEAVSTWLRLRREGATISSYISTDGTKWKLVETRENYLQDAIVAGLVVTNGETAFNHVSISDELLAITLEEPPAPEEPVEEDPVVIEDPVVEIPVIEEPVVEVPVVEEPVVEEPVVEEPVVEEPVVEEPVVEEPVVEEPVVEVPVVEEPVVEEPVVEEPVVEEPSTEELTEEEPVLEDPTSPESSLEEVFHIEAVGNNESDSEVTYNPTSDTFTVTATGGKVGAKRNDFDLVYREITGDVSITVKVDSITTTGDVAEAGIMFTSTLDENSKYSYLTVTNKDRISFKRRVLEGKGTSRSGRTNITVPTWLRMIREGNYIHVYYSADGEKWNFLSEDIIDFPETIKVGLVATAKGDNNTASAEFSGLSILDLSEDEETSTFMSSDIGYVGLDGTTAIQGDTFILESAGTNCDGYTDSFHFAYREVQGDFEFTATLQDFTAAKELAMTGLMARESLKPYSPYFAIMNSNANGIASQIRYSENDTALSTQATQVEGVVTLKITRSGNLFSASYSTDGQSWNLIQQIQHELPESILLGIAQAADSLDQFAYSEYSQVSIIQ